jgi:uncharacterized protein YjbI with pentapeptide repeats
MSESVAKVFEILRRNFRILRIMNWYFNQWHWPRGTMARRTGTIEVVNRILRDLDEDVFSSFTRVLGSNKPAAGAALAFYTKPGERPNSFEFLHKTFAEYLVSRRLVGVLDAAVMEFSDVKSGRSAKEKTLDFAAFLKEWIRLTGPRPMDADLLGFLKDEVLRYEKENGAELPNSRRDFLVRALHVGLRDGMPAHELFQLRDDQLARRPQSFLDALEQAMNSEEMLLALLHCTVAMVINDAGFEPVDIRFSGHGNNSVRGMLSRLSSRRNNPLVVKLLDGLNFSYEHLSSQYLFHAEANKANFSNCNLFIANLTIGKFNDSKFVDAELGKAAMTLTRLNGADFSKARMNDVNLTDSYLEGAIFHGADLSEAKLVRASLIRANLEGANLNGANLEGANLRGANLSGSDLRRARLGGANFENANLSGAILDSVA